MTYCLGMRLNAGMVFVADSRTNAGVDSVATFRKCFVFDDPDDRIIVILTAGNLAVTQSVISLLEDRLGSSDPERSLYACESMYEVARLVGRTVREVYVQDGEHLKEHGADFNASLIVGGQIRNRRMRLFNVYSAGNFIEATDDTPYMQIGETKYGKPIIERVLTPQTPLIEAAKCALVSFDSTIKGNLSVAPPLDLVICPVDTLRASVRTRINDNDPYWQGLRKRWGEGLRNLFSKLPDPSWAQEE
ncbi:proteasome-type protease [Telmatospirillum sp. J64-1]|uniref:proteasome-type protease n=1 Tax=Telmatospirillum sp. J64-1 TaxID=2502183 RepID=UPI00115CDCC9|nr:proteasome-type protease [Telmatospirillum sp. J64-1]